MLDVITKKEFWEWLDSGLVPLENTRLKTIQDGWIMSRLGTMQDAKICEMGGGYSRVLPLLSARNECWLVDSFDGTGLGPTHLPRFENVKLCQCNIGSMDPRIPDNYFDILFSISVIEHVESNMGNILADSNRILKVGGKILHAIDLFLGDTPPSRMGDYLKMMTEATNHYGFEPVEPVAVDESLQYSCRYASIPVNELYQWTKMDSRLLSVGKIKECVSLKTEWTKKRSL